MKKIYVIVEAMICTNFTVGMYNISDVSFVFTSKKKAHEQLDAIKEKVENGGWWMNSKGEKVIGKVLKDSGEYGRGETIYRDVEVQHPQGCRAIWRMKSVYVNSGYGI